LPPKKKKTKKGFCGVAQGINHEFEPQSHQKTTNKNLKKVTPWSPKSDVVLVLGSEPRVLDLAQEESHFKPGMVVYAYNPCTREAEANSQSRHSTA
jgi:hypothetical protein